MRASPTRFTQALALAGLLLSAACQRTASPGGTGAGGAAAAGGSGLKMTPEEVIKKMEAYDDGGGSTRVAKIKQMAADLRWMESPQFYPRTINIAEPLTKNLQGIKPGYASVKITVTRTKLKEPLIGITPANWILTIDGEKITPVSTQEFHDEDAEYKQNGDLYAYLHLQFEVKPELLAKDLEKFTLENTSDPKRLWSINAKEILPRYQKIREACVAKGEPVVFEQNIGIPRWPFVPVLVDQ